jgi:hypothetical protein
MYTINKPVPFQCRFTAGKKHLLGVDIFYALDNVIKFQYFIGFICGRIIGAIVTINIAFVGDLEFQAFYHILPCNAAELSGKNNRFPAAWAAGPTPENTKNSPILTSAWKFGSSLYIKATKNSHILG